MKKLALSLAVLFSVALVSCGGAKTEAVDSESVAEETAVVVEESVSVDSADTTVAVAAAEVAE